MKRRPDVVLLSSAFACATLLVVAFPSQNAVAASGGIAGNPTKQAPLGWKLAENSGPTGVTDTNAALDALIKGDEARRAKAAANAPAKSEPAITKPEGHGSLPIDETLFPTASQCGECHKQIYDEWSSSQHAYASISPMFHKFEQKFQDLTQGTVGTFCVRCHQQIGTQLGESRETPLWARSQISREGVSCITCHRVKEQYGKVNGERRVEPGKIYEPVYGSGKQSVIKDVIADKENYSVKTSVDGRGNDIHKGMITNDQITKSEFCVSCHQVAVNLGIKLEIVWDQYRDSPARKAGVSCQDCHMGKVAGKPEGYSTAPSAVVGGKEINPGRKHANHRFIGPGYSIGMFLPMFAPSLHMTWLLDLGIILFSVAVAFTIVTLPVEFNASNRALIVLEKGGYLTVDEIPGARLFLRAAAWTYVAAATTAILTLLRLIILRNQRN